MTLFWAWEGRRGRIGGEPERIFGKFLLFRGVRSILLDALTPASRRVVMEVLRGR